MRKKSPAISVAETRKRMAFYLRNIAYVSGRYDLDDLDSPKQMISCTLDIMEYMQCIDVKCQDNKHHGSYI